MPNTYRVQVLKLEDFPTLIYPKDIITFKDYSVADEERCREVRRKDYPKPPYGVPLPDPELIGFHRAIAKVLHMSGAAQAISLAMDRLHPASSAVKAMDADELALRLSTMQLMDSMSQVSAPH